MTSKKILYLIENNIDFLHYALLHSMYKKEHSEELLSNAKIVGNLNALVKKGYLNCINNEYICTDKVVELLEENKPEAKVISLSNFNTFITETHIKLVEKVQDLTQKSNFKNPSGKLLLPGLKELEQRMLSYYKKYNSNYSYTLITEALLNYTEDAILKRNKAPMCLIYFIWNEKNNSLYSEMNGYIEMILDNKEKEQKVTVVSNTKELF